MSTILYQFLLIGKFQTRTTEKVDKEKDMVVYRVVGLKLWRQIQISSSLKPPQNLHARLGHPLLVTNMQLEQHRVKPAALQITTKVKRKILTKAVPQIFTMVQVLSVKVMHLIQIVTPFLISSELQSVMKKQKKVMIFMTQF